MRDEVTEYLPDLAARRHLNLGLLQAALAVLPVTWIEPERYQPYEGIARQRMGRRDVEDWPCVALALALSLPIWSQDKDLQESGLLVYTTGNLLDLLGS